MTWSKELLQHLEPATNDKFADYLNSLATQQQNCWEHSNLSEEQGLEIWLKQLVPFGKQAYCTAAAAAARYAYPIVIELAEDMAMECGLHEDSESMDGESEGMKVRRVENWLQNPNQENFDLVNNAIDPSRQLEVWEEDLYPSEDAMWWWFIAVGQLCAQAVAHEETGGEEDPEDSCTWEPSTCAIRCVLVSLKAIRQMDGSITNDVNELGKAIVTAFKS